MWISRYFFDFGKHRSHTYIATFYFASYLLSKLVLLVKLYFSYKGSPFFVELCTTPNDFTTLVAISVSLVHKEYNGVSHILGVVNTICKDTVAIAINVLGIDNKLVLHWLPILG